MQHKSFNVQQSAVHHVQAAIFSPVMDTILPNQAFTHCIGHWQTQSKERHPVEYTWFAIFERLPFQCRENLYIALIKPWHCQWAQSVKGHPLDHSLSSWAFTLESSSCFLRFLAMDCHCNAIALRKWSPTWALHLKCLLSKILISWSQKLDFHVIQYLTNPITCSTCMAHILRLYQVVSRSQYFPMFQCWLLLPRQSC